MRLGDKQSALTIGGSDNSFDRIEDLAALSRWMRTFAEDGGREVALRMAIAMSRHVLRRYDEWYAENYDGAQDRRLLDSIETLEAYTLNPETVKLDERLSATIILTEMLAAPRERDDALWGPAYNTVRAVVSADGVARMNGTDIESLQFCLMAVADAMTENNATRSAQEIKGAIAQELKPWLTGDVDWLRNRVQTRQEERMAETA